MLRKIVSKLNESLSKENFHSFIYKNKYFTKLVIRNYFGNISNVLRILPVGLKGCVES